MQYTFYWTEEWVSHNKSNFYFLIFSLCVGDACSVDSFRSSPSVSSAAAAVSLSWLDAYEYN